MLTIDKGTIEASGGLLAALSDASVEYFSAVLSSCSRPTIRNQASRIERTIVHADPHLDEFAADLLFRASLPREHWGCGFIEQIFFSASDDLGAKLLWPTSAVIGIGAGFSGGISPLFLFDEHGPKHHRTSSSAAQIVIDETLQRVPTSIARLLLEINSIDEYGGGHPQNLNNIIKVLNEARFQVAVGEGAASIGEVLPPEWKRAIIAACLAAILYCLENGIDLVNDPDVKKRATLPSLDRFLERTALRSDPHFAATAQRMKSIYADQQSVFRNALIIGSGGPLVDQSGTNVPQLLLASRILFACEQCWGNEIRDLIAVHFWESLMQAEIEFRRAQQSLEVMVSAQRNRAVTPVGTISHSVLGPMKVEHRDFRGARTVKPNVWILSVQQALGARRLLQALQNYLNENNFGLGILFISNPEIGTSALLRGSAFPETAWTKIVEVITSREPDLWHIIRRPDGVLAPFILNGSRARQYISRTTLTHKALAELVRRNAYK